LYSEWRCAYSVEVRYTRNDGVVVVVMKLDVKVVEVSSWAVVVPEVLVVVTAPNESTNSSISELRRSVVDSSAESSVTSPTSWVCWFSLEAVVV